MFNGKGTFVDNGNLVNINLIANARNKKMIFSFMSHEDMDFFPLYR